MQVSSDGILRYIGKESIRSRDGNDLYYTITFADEGGGTLKMFCDQAIFQGCEDLKFGDPLSVVLTVTQYNKGVSTRIKEVIVNG